MQGIEKEELMEMSITELRIRISQNWDEQRTLRETAEAEGLRLDAIERKMQTADDPLGNEFEYWRAKREKQLKKIRRLGEDIGSARTDGNNLERELERRRPYRG